MNTNHFFTPVYAIIVYTFAALVSDVNGLDCGTMVSIFNLDYGTIEESYGIYEDPSDEVDKFHYATHYSCDTIICYFLIRLELFTRIALELHTQVHPTGHAYDTRLTPSHRDYAQQTNAPGSQPQPSSTYYTQYQSYPLQHNFTEIQRKHEILQVSRSMLKTPLWLVN